MEDKLVVVGGDHGNRFSWSRTSLGGRFEERMPFMSVSLPHRHVSILTISWGCFGKEYFGLCPATQRK